MKESKTTPILAVAAIVILFCHSCTSSGKPGAYGAGYPPGSEAAGTEVLLKDLLLTNIFLEPVGEIPSGTMLYSADGGSVTIGGLMSDAALVFRFTERCCRECVEAELKTLLDWSRRNSFENVIMLATYSTINPLRIFKQQHDITLPVYLLSDHDNFLPAAIDKLNVPYYFILNDSLSVSHQYVPSTSFGDVTGSYLSHVCDIVHGKNRMLSEIRNGVEFHCPVADLGKVETGREYTVRYDFTNNMKTPLIINDIKTTCGCTVASWSAAPVGSGSESTIVVKFTPEHAGYFQKQIIVMSNAANRSVRLLLKGESI